MKRKILLSILATAVVFTAEAQEEIVNIPNNIFKTYLLANLDINTNEDNEIQVTEATAYTGTIDVTNLGISDLTGIEAFISLTELKARSNNLTYLNVSNNTALTLLNCGYNDLTSLDVSNNTALIELQCSNNDISFLNVSNNTVLTKLNAQSNNLSTLDLSNNTALIELNCSYNQMVLLDVSANVALKVLNFRNNQVSYIDVGSNIDLTSLSMAFNQISSLDVSQNIALKYISCNDNQLTSIDVSNNIVLEQLACGNNKVNSLDISNNSTLWYLACFNNQLASLIIANGNNHNFTTLNTTGNPELECIQVDDEDYSNANWTGGTFTKDVFSTFSESCDPLNVNLPSLTQSKLVVYPNPTYGLVHFSENTNMQVVSTLGQIISEKRNSNSFDFSNHPTNIYFIIFTDNLGRTIQRSKIVKQ